eukprot:gene4533-2321_t
MEVLRKNNMLVQIGISSGMAQCGNVGCMGLKRFLVVGLPCYEAQMLASMGERFQKQLLVSGSLFVELQNMFYMRAVERFKIDDSPHIIKGFTLMEEVQSQDEEWLYLVGDETGTVTKVSVLTNYNAAMQFIWSGNVAKAQEKVAMTIKNIDEACSLSPSLKKSYPVQAYKPATGDPEYNFFWVGSPYDTKSDRTRQSRSF